MRLATEPVAALIHAMSGAEKAYFKKRMFSFSGKGNADYIKLFDLYVKGKEIPPSGFKNLPRLKNYLFHEVLGSLTAFHSPVNNRFSHREDLNSVEVLFEKGFYEYAQKLLDRRMPVFLKNFDLSGYIDGLEWRRKIAFARLDFKAVRETLAEQELRIRQRENIFQYEALYSKVYELTIRTGNYSRNKVMKEYGAIMKHPLLKNGSRALTVESRSYFYRIISIYCGASGDYRRGYRVSMNRVSLLEAEPDFVRLDQQNYINALNNALHLGFFLQKEKKVFHLLKKLKAIQPANQHIQVRRDVRSLIGELQFSLITSEFGIRKSLEKEAGRLENDFVKLVRKDEWLEIFFLLSALFFNAGDHKIAAHWVNKFFSESSSSIRNDLIPFARILNVAIHYRQGNYDLVEYLLRNAKVYFASIKGLNRSEVAILDFIDNELGAPSKGEEFGKKLSKLHRDLSAPIRNDPKNFFIRYILL